MSYENFDDVDADLSCFIEDVYNEKRLHSAPSCLSPARFKKINSP